MSLKCGQYYRFLYPAHNYSGCRVRLEERRVRVIESRDTFSKPLEAASLQADPLLVRGQFLYRCFDLDRGDERHFWDISMMEVRETRAPAEDEVLYAAVIVDIDEAEIAFRAKDRESCDGFAWGFNGSAVADGSCSRAVVLADCDL